MKGTIRQFIIGRISREEAALLTGKSVKTVYRYAQILQRGGKLPAARSYRRRYGLQPF